MCSCAPWLTSLLPRRTVKACLRLLTPWFDEARHDHHQEPYCWGPYCQDSCIRQMHSIFWETEMPYWEKVIKRHRDNCILCCSTLTKTYIKPSFITMDSLEFLHQRWTQSVIQLMALQHLPSLQWTAQCHNSSRHPLETCTSCCCCPHLSCASSY